MSGGFEQQWFSDLPVSWTKKRADFLCTPYRITVNPDLFGDDLVAHYSIPQVQETGEPFIEPASDIDSVKLLINVPMLLVSKLNPRKKTICVAEPHPEYPTFASGEFVAIVSKKIDQQYAYYLWCSEKVTARLSATVQSVTRSHQRVKPEDILKLPWKWPPLDTQRWIAKFLNERTALIDALIKKKQELLERLAEKRQALITKAVTKGLKPEVSMKPSNIEWLGEIPAHWKLRRLKFGTTKIGSGITPRGGASVYVDSGVILLRSQNVHFDNLALGDVVFIDDDIDNEMSETRVFFGDVLLNITGASIGRCCVFDQANTRANVNQHVCIIRPANFVADFLAMFLASSVGQLQIDISQNGASREGLNFGDLGNFIVLTPPFSEQAKIAKTIQFQVDAIGEQSLRVLQSISILEEYRSAVIMAAVTGQIAEVV